MRGVRPLIDLPTLERVVVVGTTGSGKTTFAASLSRILQIPHIELDAIYWLPNWAGREETDLRNRVAELVAGSSWVLDGNYRRLRDVVWPRATALVWLNYPFPLVFGRLLWRSIERVLKQEVLWSGNRETLRGLFLRQDSLLLWAIQTYARRRRDLGALRARNEYRHLTWYEFRRPSATRRFIEGVRSAAMVRQEAGVPVTSVD